MAEPEDIKAAYDNLEEEITDVDDESEDSESISDTTPNDEPEEITAEEAISTDIPLVPAEETGHLTALVCDVCLELNLTHPKSIIECARCGKAFCYHYASSIDVQFCVNCMSDMIVEKSTITKTYEHRNDETGQLSFYRRRAREIKIGGLDWLFAQRKIPELSDTELDLTIEYHRNILGLMIAEQEKKRADKMHRYAGVRIHIPTNSTTDITHSTVTTVKKTRTISKNKATEQLATILKDLLAKGMTPEAIAKMVGGKK
jgi:hypothetical protein